MVKLFGKTSADMTTGTIWKHLLTFAVPLTLGLLFQQFYNTVDTIIVGRFVGTQALAAVGSTGHISNMMLNLFVGISTGATVVISQSFGAHDDERLFHAVHSSVASAMIAAVLFTALSLILVDPLLRFMATPEDVYPLAKEYLTTYFYGLPFLLLYNMGAAILRAVGDSTRPLIFLLISSGINIVGDLVLVVTFGLGVFGVAAATVFSEIVSAVLVFLVLSRSKENYALRWKKIHLHRETLGKILSIGVPFGLQRVITAFSNTYVQSFVNAFGSSAMAGWSVYGKVDIFVGIPGDALSQASTTFVGQNVGAEDHPRARSGVNWAVLLSVIVTMAVAGVVIVFSAPILSLFTKDPQVVTWGQYFIRIISPFYIMLCFNQIYSGALRGVNSAKIPMIVMLLSYVVSRQIFLLFFGKSQLGVALAYPVSWTVCAILIYVAYRLSALFRPSGHGVKGAVIHQLFKH